MPAFVSIRVGSLGTREDDGTRSCPRSAKNARKRSRMVLESTVTSRLDARSGGTGPSLLHALVGRVKECARQGARAETGLLLLEPTVGLKGPRCSENHPQESLDHPSTLSPCFL